MVFSNYLYVFVFLSCCVHPSYDNVVPHEYVIKKRADVIVVSFPTPPPHQHYRSRATREHLGNTNNIKKWI